MQYQTNYPYATTSQQYGAISQLREEQRRRQQEYSHALAQQVAEREQQKRRQREADRQYERSNGNFQTPPQQPQQQGFRSSVQAPPERGLFDGLGRNDHQRSRSNFARGQPPPMQPHHNLPNVMPPQEFVQTRMPQGGPAPQPNFPRTSSVVDNFGVAASTHHQPMAWQQRPSSHPEFPIRVGVPSFLPEQHAQPGWAVQNFQPSAMPQNRASQMWHVQSAVESVPVPVPAAYSGYNLQQLEPQQNFQAAYPQPDQTRISQVQNGGRRQRTDLYDGGRGNSEETEKVRRKLQQQQEIQLALERQIEEKRQQKLEAKRRQQEEDRREMERFEEDQRRQRAEQERLAEEKRRKADMEQQKAEQAAAAVAIANQQSKLQQRQQKIYSQSSQMLHQHPHNNQMAHQFQPSQQPPQQQLQFNQPQSDMFAAPSPNRHKNPFTNSRAHLFEDLPPQTSPQREHCSDYGHPNQPTSPIRRNQQRDFQNGNGAAGYPADPSELRRQYVDMREELQRQKQLVQQLQQAQVRIQHQQQASPAQSKSENIPTLSDLEMLRNELRGELAYREQLHRQELESLKRGHQQEQSPKRSPRQYPPVRNSIDLRPQAVPDYHKPREKASSPEKELKAKMPIDSSSMSLNGESEFVYFNDVKPTRKASSEDSLDEHSESVKVEAPAQQDTPQARRSTQNKIQSASVSNKPRLETLEDTEDEDENENDFQEFEMFKSMQASSVRKSQQVLASSSSIRRAAASSHRYSQVPKTLSSTSLPQGSGKWRLESLGTNDGDVSDSDDDLDASLDGDQLEALFQRNVRRHEILLGFQAKALVQTLESNQQGGSEHPQTKLAWTELHHQLESNRRAVFPKKTAITGDSSTDSEVDNQNDPKIEAIGEAALVSSSKWMPSLLTQS